MNWLNSKTLKDLTICPWCSSLDLSYKELFYSKSVSKCNRCKCEIYETKLRMWYKVSINHNKVVEHFKESLNKN